MRFMMWMVVGMTGTTAGVTVYQVATEGLSAVAFLGLGITYAGIWILLAVEQVSKRQ